MNKQIVVHPYNGIILKNKKKKMNELVVETPRIDFKIIMLSERSLIKKSTSI